MKPFQVSILLGPSGPGPAKKDIRSRGIYGSAFEALNWTVGCIWRLVKRLIAGPTEGVAQEQFHFGHEWHGGKKSGEDEEGCRKRPTGKGLSKGECFVLGMGLVV